MISARPQSNFASRVLNARVTKRQHRSFKILGRAIVGDNDFVTVRSLMQARQDSFHQILAPVVNGDDYAECWIHRSVELISGRRPDRLSLHLVTGSLRKSDPPPTAL